MKQLTKPPSPAVFDAVCFGTVIGFTSPTEAQLCPATGGGEFTPFFFSFFEVTPRPYEPNLGLAERSAY